MNPNPHKEDQNPEEDREHVLRSMQDFRLSIKEHRNRFAKDIPDYEEIANDQSYKILLEASDLTLGDTEINRRLHVLEKKKKPFQQMQAEENPLFDFGNDMPPLTDEGIDQNFNPHEDTKAEMKRRGRKVFVKEFAQLDLNAEEADPRKKRLRPQHTKESYEKTVEKQLDSIYERSKRDIETFIGENLMSKLGVAMLAIGTIILINYGISLGVITEFFRLCLGFGIGTTILFFSARYRDKIPTVSSVLVSAGTCILYYSVYLIFVYYTIESHLLAFSLNLLITLVSIGLAFVYNRESLAIFAVLGGYIVPFLAPIGSHAMMLSYLYILSVIMLVVGFMKAWGTVNILNFLGSMILLGGWVIVELRVGYNTHLALIFSTLYYITFLAMNIAFSLSRNEKISRFNYFKMTLNTMFFVAIICYTLYRADHWGYAGLFFVSMGLFNLLYTYILYKNENTDVKFYHTVVGYTIAFFTFSIYLLSENTLINIAWAAESVILLAIGLRTHMNVVKTSALLVTLLALITMVGEWIASYFGDPFIGFLYNDAVLVSMITCAALATQVWFLKTEDEDEEISFTQVYSYRGALLSIMLFVVFFIGNLELMFHTSSHFGGSEFRRLLLGLFNAGYMLMIWSFGYKFDFPSVKNNAAALVVLASLVYFLGLGHDSAVHLRNEYLQNNTSLMPFLLHYVSIGVSFISLYLVIRDFEREKGKESMQFSYTTYYACFLFIIHASMELDHVFVLMGYETGENISDLVNSSRKVGYALLWTMCCLLMMLQGMKYKIKEFRMSSLILFCIILLKFFISDFWEISVLGRIVSLIVIGGILVTISMLYNRLRRMIIDGEIKELQKATGWTPSEEDLNKRKEKDDEDNSI